MIPLGDNQRDALRAHPQLVRLLKVSLDDMWQFVDLRKAHTPPVVAGYRVWPFGWTDVLLIAGLSDVRAHRYDPATEPVWACEGTLLDVLDEIEVLPAPSSDVAPRLVIPGRTEPLPHFHPGVRLPGPRRRRPGAERWSFRG